MLGLEIGEVHLGSLEKNVLQNFFFLSENPLGGVVLRQKPLFCFTTSLAIGPHFDLSDFV